MNLATKSDSKTRKRTEVRASQTTSIEGIPVGVVFNRRIPDGTDGLSIAMEVDGKIFPASAQYGAAVNSMIQDEVLSMVHAAIKKGAPITLSGSFVDDEIAGLIYPNGSFRFDRLVAFGYSWDRNFLNRDL